MWEAEYWLAVLCKHNELDSSFRHNPVTCLVLTPEARKPAKTSSQVPPYSNELLFLCSQGCLLAGWLKAVVCYSHLCLNTRIWQREMDFILVNAPLGGRSVLL